MADAANGPPPRRQFSHGRSSAHLGSLGMRGVSEIEHGDIVARVVARHPTKRTIPIARRAIFLLKLFLVAVNVANVSNGLRCNLGSQLSTLSRVRSGALAADRQLCHADASDDDRRNGAAADRRSSCERLGLDSRAGLSALLVWPETLLLLFTLFMCARHLGGLATTLRDVDDDGDMSEESSARWLGVARGFEAVESLTTLSAMKVLPRLKQAPAEFARRSRLRMEALTEDDGVFSGRDRLVLVSELLLDVLWLGSFAIAGLSALYLKMESLAPIFAVPLWSWQPRQFAAFLGFANQMAGLVPLNQLKKEAFLLFVFTGEDAELQAHELRALLQFKAMLHMKIFRACRGSLLNGCTAALTMSPKDLQKIVIREERGGGGQRGGAKEE